MSVLVTIAVTVDNGGAPWQMEVTRQEPGDNPVYTPSSIRAAIANLAEQIDRAAVRAYGDIGPERAQSLYTRPLPTAGEITS